MSETSETPETPEFIQEEAPASALTVAEKKTFRANTSDLDKLMSQVVNLSDNNVYLEPTCPICNAACREEVEQIMIANKDLTRTKQVLKDRSGIDVSSTVVENHMSNHAVRGVKELQKVEYIKKIKRLSGSSSSTLDKIALCSNILLDRIIEINSLTPNANESVAEIEKTKSAETARLTGVFGQLLKLQASIMGEMKSTGELITIPTDAFVSIFNEAIVNAKNDGERKAIMGILDRLKHVNKGG